MFRMKTRPVIVPQTEHQRLAGALAGAWGNADFALPAMDRAGFVRGVATHDRGFDPFDTDLIGATSDVRRAEQVAAWIARADSDEVAELVVLFHVRRLMRWSKLPELVAKLDARIAEVAGARDLAPFEAADTITALCDGVAFDFAMGAPVERQVAVWNGQELVEMRFGVEGETVWLAPWPLAAQALGGSILGYAEAGYPQDLRAVELTYRVVPGA